MKIFGLKTCDTCRKAIRALPQAQFVDIRADPLPRARLQMVHDTLGAALLNTRSTTWRGLSEAERAGDPVDLLVAHPALMKRPLIEADDGTLHLGWTPKFQAELGV
ncbi:MAG: ArsC/Spx/MgsR family protein [Celeribacter sp.]